MKLGNWRYDFALSPNQNSPALVLDTSQYSDAVKWRPGVDLVLEYQWVVPDLNHVVGGTTDFIYLQSRFDWASANAALPWKYGSLLFTEETWTPGQRAEWNPGGLNLETKANWDIEGSIALAGVVVQHIVPWYESNYGTWTATVQAWYNNATVRDPIIELWTEYFSAQTAKAWNIHMHRLGKLSCVIGPTIIPSVPCISAMDYTGGLFYVPKKLWDEYLKFDMLVAYHYPSCVGCSYLNSTTIPVSASLDVVKKLRQTYNYAGKIAWLITRKWADGVGSSDEVVEKAEYEIVYPYVDYIITGAYEDQAKTIDGIQRLLKFEAAHSPSYGNLAVSSIPSGASIYLNGVLQ